MRFSISPDDNGLRSVAVGRHYAIERLGWIVIRLHPAIYCQSSCPAHLLNAILAGRQRHVSLLRRRPPGIKWKACGEWGAGVARNPARKQHYAAPSEECIEDEIFKFIEQNSRRQWILVGRSDSSEFNTLKRIVASKGEILDYTTSKEKTAWFIAIIKAIICLICDNTKVFSYWQKRNTFVKQFFLNYYLK